MRPFNFSPGPATLPSEVLEQVREELLDWRGEGASVMEISHRSKAFAACAAEAEADLRELLSVPTNYRVLFMQGGATAQFAIVPLNLAPPEGVADYVNTGHWSRKAADRGTALLPGQRGRGCSRKWLSRRAATAGVDPLARRRLRALHAQ